MIPLDGSKSSLRHDLSNPQLTAQRFQRIDLAVQTLSDMIDDLVDSTRIVTSQLRLNYRSMDLAESVRSAIEIMTPVAEGNQIKLVTDIQDGTVRLRAGPFARSHLFVPTNEAASLKDLERRPNPKLER
jgi:signal transduction histidine kinase